MRHPIRILVFDKDKGERDRLASALSRVGYMTARCATGQDARRMAASFLPDVALLEMTEDGRIVGPDVARHAGQVLSKSRLLELVWGYDAVDENLVEVHVSILRRRLGNEAAGLIQTVRGVGYVMRDDYPNPGT